MARFGSITSDSDLAGGGGGVNDFTRFLTTAAVIAATTIAASTLAIMTAGFASVGDHGDALYRKKAVIEADEPSGGKVSADGARWALVAQGDEIRVEQFGGKADSDAGGVIGTDNHAPLMAALAFTKWNNGPDQFYSIATIQFLTGHYRFSATVVVRTVSHLRGAGSSSAVTNATFLHWPANTPFMEIQAWNTYGYQSIGAKQGNDGGGSTLENLSFSGKSASTNHSLYGLLCRTRVVTRNLAFYQVAGNALELRSGSGWGGGCNGSYFENTFIHGCSRDGIHVEGNDSNVCIFNGVDCHGPGYADGSPIGGGIGGCGIFDDSPFGNVYTGVHVAGYGNEGVQRGGRAYVLLKHNWNGVGEATTPGTDNLTWYDIGDISTVYAPRFPEWTATPPVPYRLKLPVWASGTSTFLAVYVEAQAIPCHNPNGLSHGGIAWWSKYSKAFSSFYNGMISTPSGVGSYNTYSVGEPGYTLNGSATFAAVGLIRQDEVRGKSIFSHARNNAADTFGVWAYRYWDNDLQYGQGEFTTDIARVFQVTTPSTARTFGRSAAKPYVFNPEWLAIGKDADARIITMYDGTFGPPYTQQPTHPHGKGELIFNAAEDANVWVRGITGWRCVAAGTPGTFTELRAECLPQVFDPTERDIGTLAAGGVSPTFTIAVPGARFGDFVDVTIRSNLNGAVCHGWISQADEVKYYIFNPQAVSAAVGYVYANIRVRK